MSTPRAASTTGKASPRDRLLDAGAHLFYRDGVSIGVEALCRAAGVSKRSMYQLFGSKDEVLAASLERRLPGYEARLVVPDPRDAAAPRERILHVFERLAQAAAEPGYRGCPYLAALVELKDPGHEASRVAQGAKERLGEWFRAQAEHGGAADPVRLARQLMPVFDGAAARSGARLDTLSDGLAAATAATLLDAAGVR
ncbi:TetR/AcrR family transcriptional regulator [Streptomyces sp. NPDC046831]|uniref:TetR/AcrR family transcriptional regulator n=1 Tax=Streptomyces sp. NPDC046831 TaxID=3154805 RepID=UPI0033ED720C